jgi:tyrosyl-tRNA synthetase
MINEAEIIKLIKENDIFQNYSNFEKLKNALLLSKSIYCGFDPTSKSLHLGNLILILIMSSFYEINKSKSIFVIGGFTGLIGDPADKKNERNLILKKIIDKNAFYLKKQIQDQILKKNSIFESDLKKFIFDNKLIKKNAFNHLFNQNLISNKKAKEWRKILFSLSLLLPFFKNKLKDIDLINIYKNFNLKIDFLKLYQNLKINDNYSFFLKKENILNYLKQWFELIKSFTNLIPKNENFLILNNKKWLRKINLLKFLTDIGKNININKIINKEYIKNRLNDTGISYCEMSYNILQAYDFFYLYENFDNYITQIGGSDQWGNITSGLDLISKKNNQETKASGLTIKLLTDDKGKKISKSENNKIWLNKKNTSVFNFYQFLINQGDKESIFWLKTFIFLSNEQRNHLINFHYQKPFLKLIQYFVADILTLFVHDWKDLIKTKIINNFLFNQNYKSLKNLTKREIINQIQNHFYLNQDQFLIDILINYQICKSKREAKELILNGGIYINDKKIIDKNYQVSKKDKGIKNLIWLKKSKNNIYLFSYQNKKLS